MSKFFGLDEQQLHKRFDKLGLGDIEVSVKDRPDYFNIMQIQVSLGSYLETVLTKAFGGKSMDEAVAFAIQSLEVRIVSEWMIV